MDLLPDPTYVCIKTSYSQSTDRRVNNNNSSQAVNNLPIGEEIMHLSRTMRSSRQGRI